MTNIRGLIIVLCLATTALGSAQAGSSAIDDDLHVSIDSGTLVGTWDGEVRTFKNIPYAAPPVGSLRWAPPQLPVKWTGERKADQFGPSCPVPDWTRATADTRVSGAGYDMWSNKVPMASDSNEDCLSLNIWAPAGVRRAPVMVFLHGAGGSGAIPWWDGTNFARDGIVLVTINFRQLTLGNFAHPALTKAAGPNEPLVRYQLMDQISALKWIQRNIAAFGGDPRNVTLFG